MDANHHFGPAPQPRQLLARFWRTASRFWLGRGAWRAWYLTVLLVAIVVLQLLVQYELNQWNRSFFDALGRHDGTALWNASKLFVPLAAASITLAATSVWGRMTTQRRWRENVTRQVIAYWFTNDHLHRLNYDKIGTANPEYRISEDVRIATDAPVDLVLAFLSSVMTAITFLSVLWTVGGTLELDAFGRMWSIPGYLVIAVILYSGFFSGMMVVLGQHLTEVVEGKNQAEAEFRAFADLQHQHGGRDGLADGETAGRSVLWTALHTTLKQWRDLCWQLVRTTLVSQGNLLLAPIVAWILCVPKYLAGDMSLGALTQAAGAFVTVQAAFNWLVDNYQRLADWRSSVNRVAALLLAIDALDSVALPHNTGSHEAIEPGERVPAEERAASDCNPRKAASVLRMT